MSAKEWKEFENNEVTHSMAHYLMAIQELLKRQGYARVTDVARELEITPGSASVSLKHLKQKGWVEEDHNRFLRLSSEGERIAHEIHVNNRLLAQFFTQVLGLSEARANIDACKVEHLVSAETREGMMALMTFLSSDQPIVKKFLHAWRDTHFECPGPAACVICDDGDTCAMHTLHSTPATEEKP